MSVSLGAAALRGARVLSVAMVAVALVLVFRPVAPVLAQGKTLVVAAITTPKGLDPDFWVPGMIESVVNVYEGLTRYGRKTDENGMEVIDANVILPHLAESWTVSDDGKVYEFKLRQGVRSVYGNEMTSADVVWGWEKSVPQKRTGRFLRTVSSVENVEAIDKYNVRFTLSAANRIFLKVLTLYSPSTYDSTEVKKHITTTTRGRLSGSLRIRPGSAHITWNPCAPARVRCSSPTRTTSSRSPISHAWYSVRCRRLRRGRLSLRVVKFNGQSRSRSSRFGT